MNKVRMRLMSNQLNVLEMLNKTCIQVVLLATGETRRRGFARIVSIILISAERSPIKF